MQPSANDLCHALLATLQAATGQRHVAVLACSGGSDEHWQIYLSADYVQTERAPFPLCTIDSEGRLDLHPDHHAFDL